MPAIDIVQVRNGTAAAVNIHPGSVQSDVSSRATGLRRMMEKFQHKLPDMDIPVNARAEGRILVPWEYRQYPNMTTQNSSCKFLPCLLSIRLTPDDRRRRIHDRRPIHSGLARSRNSLGILPPHMPSFIPRAPHL